MTIFWPIFQFCSILVVLDLCQMSHPRWQRLTWRWLTSTPKTSNMFPSQGDDKPQWAIETTQHTPNIHWRDFFYLQANVGVALHQLVDQSLWVGCGPGPSCFWRRGHSGHGWIRATLGDGFRHPAAVSGGVAEHDWDRRRQTGAGTVQMSWGNSECREEKTTTTEFRLRHPSAVNSQTTWGRYCSKIISRQNAASEAGVGPAVGSKDWRRSNSV